MKTCKEYRTIARQALKGNWGMAIALYLISALLVSAATATGIGSILLTGAFSVGYAYALSALYRRGNYKIDDLFQGFRGNFGATISMSLLKTIFLFLWFWVFIIPFFVKSYSYAMAEYILADHPEMDGLEAITASKKLMKGKKGRLFCLDLSFIGWILLCIPTFGILTLWVQPWMNAARAAFYESVKDEVELPQ